MRPWAALVLLVGATMAGCVTPVDPPATSAMAPVRADGDATTQDPPIATIALAPGDAVFWDAPHLADSSVAPDPLAAAAGRDPCDQDGVTCLTYHLEVAAGGTMLRVGLDHEDIRDDYRLELWDPAGALVDVMSGRWSAEVFAHDPAPGTWTARVVAEDVANDTARLRAKLQAPEAEATGATDLLLPNLRPLLPFDIRFHRYASNLGPAGTVPWGSCSADEMLEDRVTRCLRFAFGYGNVGDGPYEVVFEPLDDGMVEGEVHQRVHLSDGSTELRDGGTYEYHATHGHYHYDGILTATLLRVVDTATGDLEPVVEAAKRGACAHDWRIAHWDAFIAAPRGQDDSGDDCGYGPGATPPGAARIGLSRGWSDIYGANLPDNYVDGSRITDGAYVLRVVIDAEGSVLETDETDNVGYAYIDVVGDDVTVLERGLGADPWDPDKVVTEAWVP